MAKGIKVLLNSGGRVVLVMFAAFCSTEMPVDVATAAAVATPTAVATCVVSEALVMVMTAWPRTPPTTAALAVAAPPAAAVAPIAAD